MIIRAFLIALALLGAAAPALAQTADETSVRAVIADWYKRIGTPKADAPWIIFAPGGVDNGPGYSVPADLHSGSAAIRGPFLNHEMASRAMQFAWEIDVLKVDPNFAKVIVVGARLLLRLRRPEDLRARRLDALPARKAARRRLEDPAARHQQPGHPAQQDHRPDARPPRALLRTLRRRLRSRRRRQEGGGMVRRPPVSAPRP